MNKAETILRKIAATCTTSKVIKGGVAGDTGMIFSDKNDTWAWFHCYSPYIESLLTSEGLHWAYAFEPIEEDKPQIAMFFTEGDAKKEAQRILDEVRGTYHIETKAFKDVCNGYDDTKSNPLMEVIMQYADQVLEIDEV